MTYSLTHHARPWGLNSERSNHWRQHRALTAEWRGIFHLLALEQKVPRLDVAWVLVTPELANRAHMPDTAAGVGAFKAALDGLVDAGVLVDDGPEFVRGVLFAAPRVTGRDAFTLTLFDSFEGLAEAWLSTLGEGGTSQPAARGVRSVTSDHTTDHASSPVS